MKEFEPRQPRSQAPPRLRGSLERGNKGCEGRNGPLSAWLVWTAGSWGHQPGRGRRQKAGADGLGRRAALITTVLSSVRAHGADPALGTHPHGEPSSENGGTFALQLYLLAWKSLESK